jgi:hypothetical protein
MKTNTATTEPPHYPDPESFFKDLKSLAEELEWPEPSPIAKAVRPLPFDVGTMLPPAFRAFVEDVARRLSAPCEMVALPLVVAAGAAIGRGLGIRPKARDTWTEYANLYAAIVAPPSSMKSPSLAEALKPIYRIEAERRQAHLFAMEAWAMEIKRHEIKEKATKATKAKAAKAASEGLEMFEVPGEPPPQPAERRLIVNASTPEKLVETHSKNPRGLLVLRDELAGWFGDLERAGRESERAFYLEAWTGKNPFRNDTLSRGSDFVPAACVSLYGNIQPSIFRQILVAPAAQGRKADGLFERFLLVAPAEVAFQYRDEPPDTRAALDVEKVFRRLIALNTEEGLQIGNPADREGDTPFLRYDKDAQELFVNWIVDLQRRVKGFENPLLQGLIKKQSKTVNALALIFELVLNPTPQAVSVPSFEMAVAWGRYLESHAAAILNPVAALEGELLERLGTLGDTFNTRDVHRKQWRHFTELNTCREVLKALEDAGHVRQMPRDDRPGRPSEVWELHPQHRAKR